MSATSAHVADLNGDDVEEIIVIAVHETDLPDRLSVWTMDGRLLATYWSAGHIATASVEDLDPEDGYGDLLVTLMNNRAGMIVGAGLPQYVDNAQVIYQGVLILRGSTLLGGEAPWVAKSPPGSIGDEKVPGRHDAYALLGMDSDRLRFGGDNSDWARYDPGLNQVCLTLRRLDREGSFRARPNPEFLEIEFALNSYATPEALCGLIRIDSEGTVTCLEPDPVPSGQ